MGFGVDMSLGCSTERQHIGARHLLDYVKVLKGGVLVFNCIPQLLYMDGVARELCTRLNVSQTGFSATGLLPPEITMLSSEMAKVIKAQNKSEDYTPFEMTHLTGSDDQPVLLCGYGLPGGGVNHEGRILVLLEDIALRRQIRAQELAERFHFTERELAVVKNLSKGYTNKEIASTLGITEQNVKEAIKRIMHKTNTATRTGILIEVFGL